MSAMPAFEKRALAAIFLAGLALRALVLLELADTPLFAVLLGDGRQYYAWAMEIAAGDWLGQEVFYQAPLYPYLMATLLKLFGPGLWPLRILQILLGAAACVLLALAGRRFVSPRAGLFAGALLAVYPPALFFDSLVQKTSVASFLTAALLALLAEAAHGPARRWLVLAGGVLGCLALTRENALILVPVLFAWILLQAGGSRRRRLGRAGLFAFGLIAVLLPVALRNQAVGGQLALTTAQLGPNFYIGNNPQANGRYRPLRPGRQDARVERRDAVELAEADAGEELSAGEVSRYWLRRSLDWTTAEPAAWVELLLKKAFLVIHAREVVDTESPEVYREHSRLLRWLAWLHFGVLGPLAAIGVWATRGDWRRLWVLYAYALAIAASLVLFYVVARYRFSMVPVVTLFAGAGLVALADAWRDRSLKPLAGALALAALAAVGQNWPVTAEATSRATTTYNLGIALFEQGDDSGARLYLEKTVALLPEFAAGHVSLGKVLAAQGELAAAQQAYEAALAIDPEHAEARAELAHLLERRGHERIGTGDLAAAEEDLRRAARLDPSRAMAHNLLGNLHAQRGEQEDAIARYERALELDTGIVDARFKLGLLRSGRGELDAARRHLEEAARRLPRYPDAHLQLAAVLERLGERDAAAASYRRVLELRPDDPMAVAGLRRLGLPGGG